MQSFHCITKYRSRYCDIQPHKALTSRVERFSVIKGQSGLVHEKIYKLIMSEPQSTAIKPYEE